MTALHQYQSQVPSLRRPAGVSSLPLLSATYSGAVSSCAPQLGIDRVPIAICPSFFPRKLALQSQFAHIHSQLLEHFSKYVSKRLHRHFQTVLSSVASFVGFDANENGLTYAKILFASGAKEND